MLLLIPGSVYAEETRFRSEFQDMRGRGEYLSAPILAGLAMFQEPTAPGGFAFGFGEEKLWHFAPGLRFTSAFDSNVNRTRQNKDADVIFSYVPSAKLYRSGTQFSLESEYGMEFEQFLRGESDNSFNQFFFNKFGYKTPKVSADLNHELRYADERFNTEANQRRTTLSNRVTSELGYIFSAKFSVSAVYENFVFYQSKDDIDDLNENQVVNDVETGLSNRNYVSNLIGGRAYYHWSPKLDIYVEGNGSLFNYKNGFNDNVGYNILVGSRGTIGKKVIMSMQGGVLGKFYDRSDIDDFTGFVVEGIIDYQMIPGLFDIQFSGRREVVESLSIGEAYFEANRVSLKMNYRISPLMQARTGINFQINDYPQPTVRDGTSRERLDFITFADARIIYNPIDHVEVSVSYLFRSRNSNFSNLKYTDHYVESSIAYTF